MKRLILLSSVILFCTKLFSQEYDTIRQNEYYTVDTVGIRYIFNYGATDYSFDADDGYGAHGILDAFPGNTVVGFRGLNIKNELQATGIGINILSLYNDTLHLGTNLFIGQFDSRFYDFRPAKRGIEYNESGYVKQLHSLTDKEYVDKHQLTSKTKTTLPNASPAGQIIYVSNAFGGGVPAYSDGTNWRRVSDQTIIN